VVGRSVVETSGAPNPGPEVDWAGVDRVSDRWSEFLLASHFAPRTSSWSTTRQRASPLRRPPRRRARGGRARERRLAYVRGSTSVSTTGPEAWRRGSGVCQDFAHITIGILRSMGIPARYVSGTCTPRRSALGEEVVVRATRGGGVARCVGAFDPTGLDPVAERHVVVARDVTTVTSRPSRASSPARRRRSEVEVELVRSA